MPPCLRAALPAAALVLALHAVPATASAGIVEYPGLTGAPAGITAGPDGAVWFTEQGSPGAIGRITTAGAITEFRAGDVPGFTADAQPADIVAGPDGALWFTETDATGAIGRFDPVTETVTEFTDGLTPNSEPAGIAVGPDGNLWFAERSKGAIGRITPDGDITEFSSGLSGSSEPADIAAGPDGKLWFTEAADPGRIGRIDPGTGAITEFSEGLTPDGAPTSIVAGEEKLYFTLAAASRIGRIDTAGEVSETPAGVQPRDIALGGDGALWFTDPGAPGRLGRLWPGSSTTQVLTGGVAPGFSAGGGPTGITRGPDGNVWYAQRALPAIARVTLTPAAEVTKPKLLTDGRFRLRGTVGANGQPTTYFFEYGPTTAYGSQTATASAGAGGEPAGVAADVEIAREAPLHVRLTATNGTGATLSPDAGFYVTADGSVLKDKPEPPPVEAPGTPPPPPAPEDDQGEDEDGDAGAPPSPPVLGETVTVHPRTGRVRIRRPRARRFVPLEAGASIPVGSRIDARAGKVVLRTALDAAGRSQKGTFWGAIFQVRQRRGGRGMTELALRGGNFSRCSRKLASIAAVPRRDAGRRRIRSLWGRDRHGRFRTHGRDSVATVRGTVWRTTDRCDGTLTRVKHGKVLVRDLRLKRRVLVKAGRSYLARHVR